jgi:hypothetical protein
LRLMGSSWIIMNTRERLANFRHSPFSGSCWIRSFSLRASWGVGYCFGGGWTCMIPRPGELAIALEGDGRAWYSSSAEWRKSMIWMLLGCQRRRLREGRSEAKPCTWYNELRDATLSPPGNDVLIQMWYHSRINVAMAQTIVSTFV